MRVLSKTLLVPYIHRTKMIGAISSNLCVLSPMCQPSSSRNLQNQKFSTVCSQHVKIFNKSTICSIQSYHSLGQCNGEGKHFLLPLQYFISNQQQHQQVGSIKIYTKTGDRGTSATLTGQRHSKHHNIFEALGTLDELSAQIGLAKEFGVEKKHSYSDQLERIQCLLQDAASTVARATPRKSESKSASEQNQSAAAGGLTMSHVEELEAWIDHYTQELPPLKNFILPGGGRASAGLHVVRAICRRAERTVVALLPEYDLDNTVTIYINRLSDYLFTIARYATLVDGSKEVIYINPGKRTKPSITD